MFKVCFFISTVLDDEDTSITAGSIVTVEVSLKRQMMEVLFDKEDLSHVDEDQDNMAIGNEDNESNKDQVKIEGGSMIKCDKDNLVFANEDNKINKDQVRKWEREFFIVGFGWEKGDDHRSSYRSLNAYWNILLVIEIFWWWKIGFQGF